MDDIMKQIIQEELQKCKKNPYYFATNYLKIYDQDDDEHPYTTLKELEKDKNGTSHITQACNGEVYSAFGFRWSFTEELIKRDNRLGKCKIMIEKDGIEMQFKSQVDAALYITSLGFKCNQGRISNSFKRGDKVYGFKISKINE